MNIVDLEKFDLSNLTDAALILLSLCLASLFLIVFHQIYEVVLYFVDEIKQMR
jgi:hypothetical protein